VTHGRSGTDQTDETPHNQGKEEGSRGHKRLIYELFVLGELMDGPSHGYKLREVLSSLFGPFRQISWGILYPLIRDLEREGFIAAEREIVMEEREQAASGIRQRRHYTITATGRARFYALMLEQGDYNADYRELFIAKLNNFDHLSPEQQLVVLSHYRGYLLIEALYLKGGKLLASTDAAIPESQRAHIHRNISFKESSLSGEIQWIERFIKSLEDAQEEQA
jgi:DNA-binding PadR family transcriptional regulator